MNSLAERYPRTLYEWLKTDDKALTTAIAAGQTVYEAADTLQREPVGVLRRLDHLSICPFAEFSEEWVVMMSLSLASVPMEFVTAWCTASDDRLPYDLFASMADRDLGPAFELARQHRIIVANVEALDELAWLADQPADVQAGYGAACQRLLDAFDVLTPATLKCAVLGLEMPSPVWARASAATTPGHARRTRRTTSRRRGPSTTTRTIYARKSGSRYTRRTA